MLSNNFSLAEAIASETAERNGIDNTPPTDILVVMNKTAIGMERVRAMLGNKSIHTNSWYRCHDLNLAVGSKDTSQHPKGEAVDFICPLYGSPLDICKLLIANQSLIRFDQLILEHTWVHISFAIVNGNPRNQVLSLLSSGHYAPGLTDKNGVKYE